MAAIVAHHSTMDGISLVADTLIVTLLKGVRLLYSPQFAQHGGPDDSVIKPCAHICTVFKCYKVNIAVNVVVISEYLSSEVGWFLIT